MTKKQYRTTDASQVAGHAPLRNEKIPRNHGLLATDRADVRFLLECVQHISVKVIARELHRSEKAIWRKVGDLL